MSGPRGSQERTMSFGSTLSDFIVRHIEEPFVSKPGLHLPAGTVDKTLTVKGGLGAAHWRETFTQHATDAAKSTRTGAVLDMIPTVKGGLQPGDLVLRGWTESATAEAGGLATLTRFLRTGSWKPIKSKVSHVAVVVRDPAHANELRVIQWVDDPNPAALDAKLSKTQKFFGATFLENVSVSEFFNVPNAPITETLVMRPKDPNLSKTAASGALKFFDTQVQTGADGKTILRPWYPKIPHSLAPDGRGGVCSTFVNQALGDFLKEPLHIPVTPEHFVQSPAFQNVGETTVSDIQPSQPVKSISKS